MQSINTTSTPYLHTPASIIYTVPDKLGIPVVPMLFHGSVKSANELREIIDALMQEPSELGGEREGLVVRASGTIGWDTIPKYTFKVVRANHVQPDAEHWSKNWKKADILPPVLQSQVVKLYSVQIY